MKKRYTGLRIVEDGSRPEGRKAKESEQLDSCKLKRSKGHSFYTLSTF